MVLCDVTHPEDKLCLVLSMMQEYIKDQLDKKKLKDDYTYPQN
jgi:hypothetical protein